MQRERISDQTTVCIFRIFISLGVHFSAIGLFGANFFRKNERAKTKNQSSFPCATHDHELIVSSYSVMELTIGRESELLI